MDKVTEKKENTDLCNLLATEGYGVMLLPIVQGSAWTLLNALIVQQKKRITIMLGKGSCMASSTYTAYALYKNLRPNGDAWKNKSQFQKQGQEYEAASRSSYPTLFIGAGWNTPTSLKAYIPVYISFNFLSNFLSLF